MEKIHYPVMYREAIENLQLQNKKVIVDCTVGVGTHAFKFLENAPQGAYLVGMDKDEDSLRVARARLKKYDGNFSLVQDDFRNLDKVLDNLGIEKVDAFFFDLGISTYQLANAERGFSFLGDGPLDMRMNRNSFLSAYDLVNNLSETELSVIFKKFGEEKFSRRIAHSVVESRRESPITTTAQLSGLVVGAVPKSYKKFKTHPATRIFQALRIAVNRELESLTIGLEKAIKRTSIGGRMAVISFHSLEDRIVKHTFRDSARNDETLIINKKPYIPSDLELEENNASRSAKLRVIEKIN